MLVPPSIRGMAHRSYLSPDGTVVLVTEMDSGGMIPCRIVPFDGSSEGRGVGPATGQCTHAAWSPDGRWMYFTSDASGSFQIWRQRFPDGKPEQLTFGPTEAEGLAVSQTDAPGHLNWIGPGCRVREREWQRPAGVRRRQCDLACVGRRLSDVGVFAGWPKTVLPWKHTDRGEPRLWWRRVVGGRPRRRLAGTAAAWPVHHELRHLCRRRTNGLRRRGGGREVAHVARARGPAFSTDSSFRPPRRSAPYLAAMAKCISAASKTGAGTSTRWSWTPDGSGSSRPIKR